MIQALHEPYDTTAQRCIELIQRHAPRLMRTGSQIHAELLWSGHPVTAAERQEIVRLRQGGLAMADIAARVRRSPTTVCRCLRAAGCVLARGPSGPKHLPQPERVLALRAAGRAWKQVAAELRISVPLAQKWIRDWRRAQQVKAA